MTHTHLAAWFIQFIQFGALMIGAASFLFVPWERLRRTRK